jgi:hypothetical protein
VERVTERQDCTFPRAVHRLMARPSPPMHVMLMMNRKIELCRLVCSCQGAITSASRRSGAFTPESCRPPA